MARSERSSRASHRHKRSQVFRSDGGDYGGKQLEQELASQGLYIKEITGDGNCLFRSLSDQLGESNTHERIRHEVVQYLRSHQTEFDVFVEEDYDGYVNRMSNDGVYGDNLEIVAFSRVYGRHVKVYQPGMAYVISPTETEFDGSVSQMLHIAYHSWEHYSSIRNAEGPHDGEPCVKYTTCKTSTTLKRRDPDAPPSDMEKICLASVPGSELFRVRALMQEHKGNINAVVELLLEEEGVAEAEATLAAHQKQVEKHTKEPDQFPSTTSTAVADLVAVEPKSVGLNSDSDKQKRRSARDKKQQAKKDQKQAARVRRREDKSNRAGHVDRLEDSIRTISI